MTVRDVAEFLGDSEEIILRHHSAWIPERNEPIVRFLLGLLCSVGTLLGYKNAVSTVQSSMTDRIRAAIVAEETPKIEQKILDQMRNNPKDNIILQALQRASDQKMCESMNTTNSEISIVEHT